MDEGSKEGEERSGGNSCSVTGRSCVGFTGLSHLDEAKRIEAARLRDAIKAQFLSAGRAYTKRLQGCVTLSRRYKQTRRRRHFQ